MRLGHDASVSRLLVTLGALGLVVGLGCALLLHALPTSIVGRFGWFAYTPAYSSSSRFTVNITVPWLPSILVFPGVGVAVGLIVGLVLALLGWRLAKRTS